LDALEYLIQLVELEEAGVGISTRRVSQTQPASSVKPTRSPPQDGRCIECGALLEGGERGLCYTCRGRPKPAPQTRRMRSDRLYDQT
jgi:hypothetical protein